MSSRFSIADLRGLGYAETHELFGLSAGLLDLPYPGNIPIRFERAPAGLLKNDGFEGARGDGDHLSRNVDRPGVALLGGRGLFSDRIVLQIVFDPHRPRDAVFGRTIDVQFVRVPMLFELELPVEALNDCSR